MDSIVLPDRYVAVQMSSGLYKLVKATPNTIVSMGKYGSFHMNQIIGRPFHLTYELLNEPGEDGYGLRVVPVTELHAEALISEGSGEGEGLTEETETPGNIDQQPMRTNREINDDGSAQSLTWEEIEELKRNAIGTGKEIIDKLLESHSTIDKKTAFSLAKYKLKKEKKYLKRFTVLPLDVNIITDYMLDRKEANKILELRPELIGLLGCWGNVHHSGNLELDNINPSGRYLVMDDTGGLVVAAMAERMGILYPPQPEDYQEADSDAGNDRQEDEAEGDLETDTAADQTGKKESNGEHEAKSKSRQRNKRQAMGATGNTITVIHPHAQPNLSLLKYFDFDIDEPDESHPLFDGLKAVSWLQVLDPESDNLYHNRPEDVDEETLKSYKPRQRGTYYRKKARWARVKSVVDEVRAGGYDGLVVASVMEPDSILQHALPLLTGGASVVVYSPSVEPLSRLVDQYSTARRSAYFNKRVELERAQGSAEKDSMEVDTSSIESQLSSEFPLDPTLLLAPMLQTSRVREYQVLPGRTHPLMSGRGGAEGYIFHAARAVPKETLVRARGASTRKRRRLDGGETGTPEDVSTPVVT